MYLLTNMELYLRLAWPSENPLGPIQLLVNMDQPGGRPAPLRTPQVQSTPWVQRSLLDHRQVCQSENSVGPRQTQISSCVQTDGNRQSQIFIFKSFTHHHFYLLVCSELHWFNFFCISQHVECLFICALLHSNILACLNVSHNPCLAFAQGLK